MRVALPIGNRLASSSGRTVLTWAVRAGAGLGLIFASACGSSGAEPTPRPTIVPNIGDSSPESVQALLSGDALDRFQALPADYQKALASYLAFGVSPDLVPVVVEQKMAQWPEDPTPLGDLLGPDRYRSFKDLLDPPALYYHAYILLTYYVHVLGQRDTPEGQGQAIQALMDALQGQGPSQQEIIGSLTGSTSTSEQVSQVRVPRPPPESVLTPAALASLDQIGPSFQRAIRTPPFSASDIDLQVLAVTFTQYEILLLKTPAEWEMPSIEAYLSEQELADLGALPEEIRDTVEPRFHDVVLGWLANSAINPSVSTTAMPPDDFLSRQAKVYLSFAEVRAKAGKEE